MGLATLFLVTSFVVGSIAGPLSQFPENQCATTCVETKKFEYEVGKSYIYQYEATTSTELNSNSNEISRSKITALVEIQSISKCNFVLKLSDVDISNPEKTREFKSALEANPLDFSFQDGVVDALCPRSTNEPVWVLNIKRGILSAFQNSMKSLSTNHNTEETDITGKCPTTYQVGNGGWLSNSIITKSKDMLKCTDRSDHYTWIRSTPQQPSLVPQSSPIVKSSHECQLTIRQNILQKSVCKEFHRFQPLAHENSGATTEIQQTLIYQKTIDGQVPQESEISARTSLLFDHDYNDEEKKSEKDAREALVQMCASAKDDITPQIPRLFSRLVNSLKKCDFQTLQNLFSNIESICGNNNRAKKLYMDAVAMTANAASVQFMTMQSVYSKITSDEVNRWLTTLSLLPNPSHEMIAAAMPLLNLEGHRSKALLGVSALTHAYCQHHNECGGVTEVINAVKSIVQLIPSDCQTKDQESIERVVSLLKALGNIGHINRALPVLKKCYENVNNPIEVRLAAIDAHRRIPCSNQKSDILRVYLNREEDSEVRIGAYLILMKCPTSSVLDQIESSLITEDVNQVGSFVWTHLTSLKKSENPNKMMVKEILSSKKLQKKFSTDVRKFSRFYEGSIFLESIEAGAHVEGSVIFSPKSYLPRSAHLGLNLDIFGESIDLFEIGARVEGFEQLVESFFGPEGHFPDETIHQMLESYRDKSTEDKSKLNQIANIFNIKNAKVTEPQGSFHTRIFGNDNQYVTFKGLDELVQRALNALIPLHKLTKLLNGEDLEFVENVMLVDSALTIPTSIGFPLKLKVNGTAAISLQLGGKFDASQISSKSLTANGHIRPSAAVEIDGEMIVDHYLSSSGFKLTSLVHTSTEAKGEFIVKDGQMIKSQFMLPKDKMEIFDFRSSLIVVDHDRERDVNLRNVQQYRKCSGEFASKYFGLELCGELSYPSTAESTAPLFLSGPVSTSLYVQKTDKMLTSFDFEYRWSKEQVTTKSGQPKFMRVGKLSLDTHKSAVNRELTAEFVHNEADETVSIRLVSPIKKATFNGKLINEPEHKKLDAFVLIDDNECLAFQYELRVENNGNNYRLTPSMAIRLNGLPMVSFKGLALTQDRKKYSVDLTLEHLTSQPITIYGLASKTDRNDQPRYDLDFNVKSEILETFGKWFYQSGSTNVATKGTIDYKWANEQKQSITFSAKHMISQQNPSSSKLSVEAEFQWTLYPAANWVMQLDLQKNEDQMDNLFTLYYGSEQQRSHNMLSLQHSYRGHGSWPKHHLATNIRLRFPPANVDTTLDIKSDLTPKNLDTSFALVVTPELKLTLVAFIKRGDESTKELISGFTRLTYLNNELEISGNVKQPELDTLVITTTGKWAKSTEASFIVTVRNHGPSHLKSWGKEVRLELQLPNQKPLILTADAVINDEEHSAHGEAQINGQTYKTFAEYHRPSLENLRVIAGAKSPSTTYSATTEIQNKPKEKRVMSEVVLGNTRRLKSDVQFRKEGGKNSAYATFMSDAEHYPNDAYTMQMTFEKILLGSEGLITIKRPSGTEMGLEWKSRKEGNFGSGPASLNGQYQVWWAPGKKILTDINFSTSFLASSRDLTVTINIDTPWSKEISIYAQHKDGNQQWNNNLDIQYEKQPILSVITDGTYTFNNDVQAVRSNVKINFQQRLFTFKIDHQWNEKQLRTNAIVNSGQVNEYRFMVLLNDKRTMERFGFSSEIDVVTPFEQVRKVVWTADVSLVPKNLMFESQINWNGNVISAQSKTTYVIANEVNLQTNWKIKLPFESLRSIDAEFRVNNLQKNGFNTVLNIIYNQNKKIFIDLVRVAKNNTVSLRIRSPCPYFEDVQLIAAGTELRDSSKIDLKVQWTPSKYAEAEIEWSPFTSEHFFYNISVVNKAEFLPFEFRNDFEFTKRQEQFSVLFSGFLNDKTGRINIDLQKPKSSDSSLSSLKWLGLFQLNTPFPQIQNLNLTAVGIQQPRSLEGKIETAYNQHVASIFYFQSLDPHNLQQNLTIRLPYEKFSSIKYISTSKSVHNKLFFERELSWTPGPIIKAYSDMDSPINSNLSILQVNYQLFVTPRAENKPIDVIKVRLDYGLHHNLLGSPKLIDYGLNIVYFEEEIFDVELTHRHNDLIGEGELSLRLPENGVKKFVATVKYDLSNPVKSGSLIINVNELEPIAIRARVQNNYPKFILNVDVNTPLIDYKTNSLNLDFDSDALVGQLQVSVNDQVVQVSIEFQNDKENGRWIVNLKTPIQGFETTSLVTDVNLSNPRDMKLRVLADGSVGQFNLQTSYKKINQKSLQVGAVLTTSVPSFENLAIEYVVEDKLHVLKIHKQSNLWISNQLSYDLRPGQGKLHISLLTPWVKGNLSSDYALNERSKYLTLNYQVGNFKCDFEIMFKKEADQIGFLKTQFKTNIFTTFPDVLIEGEYKLVNPENRVLLKMDLGEYFKGNLEASSKAMDRNENQHRISLITSVNNENDVSVLGSVVTSSSKIVTKFEVKKEKPIISIGSTVAFPTSSSLAANFQMTVPNTDDIQFNMNYGKDSSRNAIDFRSSITLGQIVTSIDFNYQNPITDLYKLSLKMQIPQQRLSPVTSSVSLDLRQGQKKVFDFQVAFENARVEQTYRLISEFEAKTSGYLEYNLKLSTPEEDCRFYANYNVQGVHNVTYDAKLTKGKTMIESRGRFYIHPQWNRAQGSLSFNTNYQSMISSNFNGMYEARPNEVEILLQSSINGADNELKIISSKVSTGRELVLQGMSSYPQWQKFSAKGSMKNENSKQSVQLTFKRNDDTFNVKGELRKQSELTSGQFTLTTPYLEHQSLRINFNSQPGRWTFKITNNNEELINTDVTRTLSGSKTDLNVDLQSSIPWVEPINGKLSFDITVPSKIIQLNFNYGSVRFEASFSGSERRAEVNSLFTLKCSDILPYLDDDNLQVRFKYNMLTLNTELIAATRSYSLVEVKGRRENGHIEAELSAQALGSINVKVVRPSPSQTNSTWSKAEFNVEIRDVFQDQIVFQAGYDMSHNEARIPNTYFTIQKGTKIVNFSSAVTISDAFSSLKIIFKSPLENYEDVELLVHNQKTPSAAFELSARLSPDRHYIFNGIFNPNNRDLNAEYVVLTFKSPLQDYKNLNLVVKPRGFSFDSGSKQLSVDYQYTDSLLVTLANSFSKIPTKAQLAASWSATSVDARLDFNDRFMDIKGNVNLQTLKSSWSLLTDNNMIGFLAPFVLKGNYNLEAFNKFAIAQKLDVNDIKVFDMSLVATSGRFDWSITSLLDNIKIFKVQSTFNSDGKISQANIQVQFNDKKWSAAGKYNKNDGDDGFSVQIENDFPVTGIKDLRILTKRNLEGKQKLLGGELYVNNKQVGTIEGSIEINRKNPPSLRATLDVNTPWFKTDKFEFLIKYDRETGDFATSLQVDPTWIIKIEGKVTLTNLDLTLTTPFKDFDLVNVKAQLESVSPKNELLFSSSVTYKNHVVAGLNIEYQRKYFEKCLLKIDTITPFKYFTTPALHISYNIEDTNELAKIETVMKGKTADTFYGLAGKFNYQKSQMIYGEITLTTPFEKYDPVTFTLNGNKNDANEYRLSLKLQTPTGEHSINLDLTLIPNKYSGSLSLASSSIPEYPINLKFICQKYNYELEWSVAEMKRYIRWSENKDEAFNGNVIVGMESALERVGYQLNYLAKPSISDIKIEVKSLATNENIIALVYSMKNQFFKMDVGVSWYSKPLITFNYDATEGIKSVLKMTKPLFANPVDVNLIVSRKGVDFLLTANRADNYVKINIIDAKKIQASAKLPLLNIPFTSVDVVMDRQASSIDVTVSISVVGRNYKISSRIVPFERADLMLETPAHRYELKLGGTYRGYSNMLGSLQVIYDKQSHAVSAKMRSSDRDLDFEFRLDSVLLDRIKVDLDVKWAPSIEGKVELGIGQAVHRSQFKVITSKDGVNIELEVISAKTDLRSISLKSSLDEHGRLSRSVMVNTASSAPHSLAYERTYNPKMKKMQLTADTPYLRGGRHTLTGQKTNNEMMVQASTPKSTHSIKINLSKAPNGGQTVKVIINCPLMAKHQLQLTGTLNKIDRNGINGAFEFLKGSEKHKLSVDVRIRDRSFDYDISVQTPLYDINTMSSRGQLSIVDQDYVVDVVFKRSDATYMVKGSLRPTSEGISGQIKVDSPYMSPTDINVKVSWAKRGQLESSIAIQTPTSKHDCEANMMLDKGSCNGVVRMNSPLIPGQKLSFTGNVNVRSRRSVQSYFAVENPGNDFKLSSEYHSDPEKRRVLGNLVIVTPFQLVPYVKMSAQKSGDERVTEGEIEFYTVEKAEPDLRMHGRIELDNDKQIVSVSLNVQTSLPQLYNAHLKYDAPSHGKTSLVFTHDHLSYGYKFEKARMPAGQRIVNAVLLWGHRTSTLTTEIIRNSQLFLLSGKLDLQLGGLPAIQLVLTKSEDRNEKNIMSAKVVLENEDTYALTFEKYHKENSDVDARLILITPFTDFQNSVFKLVKSSNDSVQNIVLQFESNSVLKSYVEFVNKVEGSKGEMIIRIKTPHPDARSLTFKSNTDKGKTDISMYLYDHVQPITFSYNIETNVRSVGNYKVLISIPHSKYPLTLSLIKQTSSQKVFSYIAQISGLTETSKQLTLKTEIDLQGPNYKAQFGLIHPSRTIDLTSFCAVQNNGDVISSLNFKWDAGRDVSKSVGFNFKRQNQNNERTIEVDVICPGINKMVWRISSKLNVPIDHAVEYIYGTKSTEVVTFIMKKNDGVFETRVTNPETLLDVQFIANCTCNSTVHRGSVGLTYTDRNGKRQNYEIGMMTPKDKTHIELKTVWGMSKTLSTAKVVSTKEGYNLVISKQLNDDEPNKMEMQFKRLEGLKGIEIIVLDNFETKGRLSAGMPDAKSIRALSNRFSKGQATTDFDFQMELHQAKELRTLFNWKPEAVQEIQSELTGQIRDASNSFKIFVRGSQEVGIDILGQFYTTFLAVNENLNLNFAGEWESLTNDLEPWKQTFNRMYDENDFYIRSILGHIGALNIHEKIINFMTVSYDVVSRSISSVSFDSISATVDALLAHFDTTVLNWIDLAQKQVQKMPMALLNILDDVHQWGRKFINNVVIGSVKLARELVLNWIPPVGEWKEFIPLWTRRISSTVSDQIHKYIEQFLNSKYFQQLKQSLHQLNNIYNEIYSSKLWNKATSYYNLVSDRVQQQYESLQSCPWFQEVEIYAEKFYDFGKWTYKFFRVRDMANHLLDSLIARVEDIVIRVIEDTLLPQYQIPTLTSTVFYEPQQGRLEFNQTLPVPWTMFTQTPDIMGSPEYQRLSKFKDDILELPRTSIKKLYKVIKSELSWKNVSPAFRATAILAGNQHYVTFDGKAYEFAGACSYLLASDFIDKKFILSVNYQLEDNSLHTESATIKSFNLTLGNTTIVIKPDLSFEINDQKVETPTAIDTVHLTRSNDILYIEDNSRQVFLTYNRKFDVLKFEIGGFYHGKTGGLFGTYDHEPHDDLTDPSQQKVASLERFGYSWQIDTDCKDHKNHAYHSDVNSYTVQKTCKQLFDDHSLSPGAGKIQKEAYVNMCINDVSLGKSPCDSVTAYVLVCHSKGSDVEMPESCLECELGGSTLRQNEQVKISGSSIPNSADVVIVLDNTWQCSTTFPNIRRTVLSVARSVEQSLTKNKIPLLDNRFAMVGLGESGSSSSPQAISLNGEIFNNAQYISNALNATTFSAGNHHHLSELIEYAYDLPFRPGVAKIFLVIPCSESVDNEGEFDALTSKLDENNIAVHVVSIHDATLNEPNKVIASEIIGFDDEFAYTLKSLQRGKLIGNKEIRNQLEIMKNPLTTMAMETKGSVFFASKLGNTQPMIGPISNEIFARRVALTAIPAKSQNCLCTVDHNGLPKTQCSSIY